MWFLRRAPKTLEGPLLCVTHTDRSYGPKEANLNYLTRRWSQPDRLPPSVPFAELPPASTASPHLGSITFWSLEDPATPTFRGHYRPDGFKPQHAIWRNGRLWILGTEVLLVLNADLEVQAEITDPWLAGGHTVFPDGAGQLFVSCSASDAVLVVDESTQRVVSALRMPEDIYGFNFPLQRTDSVVDNFVGNDLQLTHINCAWPHRGGVLVSALAQGCIGFFDQDGQYEELLRGFVGIHGVRTTPTDGRIYFSDSAVGTVNFLTPDLSLERRLATQSAWLHDAEILDRGLVALAVTDRNTVEIADQRTGAVVSTISGRRFGAGTQFLSYGY